MKCLVRALPLAAIATTALLAACAGPSTRPVTGPAASAPPAPQAAAPTQAASPGQPATPAPPPSEKPLVIEDRSAATGITACDDYLDSYKGCHRAAGIFSADTIDQHYREMRDHLVKLSKDPKMHDRLAARCTALANQLKQALHGKPCDAEPAGNDDSDKNGQ